MLSFCTAAFRSPPLLVLLLLLPAPVGPLAAALAIKSLATAELPKMPANTCQQDLF
jgi:hypothetical protein